MHSARAAPATTISRRGVDLQTGPLANASPLWETEGMANRKLRIEKQMRGIDVAGVCEACRAEFSADPRSLGQSSVQQQFNRHVCKPQSAAPAESAKAAKAPGKK